MRLDSLYIDFTLDLEQHVKNPLQNEPIEAWNARKAAAPERHRRLGDAAHVSVKEQIAALESYNEAYNMIESFLLVLFDRGVYERIATLDPIKEQVWMFAYKWLRTYSDLLAEPGSMRSVFYRAHHEDYIQLLEQMVCMNPQKRISFVDALRKWYPSSDLLVVPSTDDVSVSSPAPVDDGPAKTHQEVSPQSPAETPSLPPQTPPQPSKTRLVLTGSVCRAGRNKTRRNRDN